MSCLADTNVLLRYVQQNHDLHGVAVAALDFLLGSGEIVVIVPQNIGAMRVLTRTLSLDATFSYSDRWGRNPKRLG